MFFFVDVLYEDLLGFCLLVVCGFFDLVCCVWCGVFGVFLFCGVYVFLDLLGFVCFEYCYGVDGWGLCVFYVFCGCWEWFGGVGGLLLCECECVDIGCGDGLDGVVVFCDVVVGVCWGDFWLVCW